MKDLFMEEYEDLYGEAIDRGLTEQQADQYAGDHAYDRMIDRIHDYEDFED